MTKNALTGILIGILALILLGCSNNHIAESEKETDKIISVKTESVVVTNVANEITVSGNVEGIKTVKLGFMVPGKINFISGKVGQFVAKGQLIASLDPTNYALGEQIANVQLEEVADEYGRLKLLHDRGSLSESDFSKTGYALKKAQVNQKIEAKNLSDTKLNASIGGILLSKEVEVGEIVSAGTPLFVLSDIAAVKVLAFVPEGELKGLRVGQEADIEIAAINKKFTGKITEVGAIADAVSRSFTVKIQVENKGLEIRPGMIAEARIITGGVQARIELPTECIINDLGNQSFVYVADKGTGKAFKRKVSLGNMLANKIQILSGLSVGEKVIISGQNKLSDGSLIIIEK